jgi:hypothetical protein
MAEVTEQEIAEAAVVDRAEQFFSRQVQLPITE